MVEYPSQIGNTCPQAYLSKHHMHVPTPSIWATVGCCLTFQIRLRFLLSSLEFLLYIADWNVLFAVIWLSLQKSLGAVASQALWLKSWPPHWARSQISQLCFLNGLRVLEVGINRDVRWLQSGHSVDDSRGKMVLLLVHSSQVSCYFIDFIYFLILACWQHF